VDITANSIDLYLRERLQQRVRIKAKLGSKRSVKDLSGLYIENLAERGIEIPIGEREVRGW
jgi:hypothetical protein